MDVVIRVDASQAIGTGHVRRMIALATALRRAGADVRFVTRDLGLDLASDLCDFPVVTLSSPMSTAVTSTIAHAQWAGIDEIDDATETIGALAGTAPDWIVVDSYAFGAAWHTSVRDATGARIVAIDDLADRPLAADLIIDHNYSPLGAAKYNDVAPGTPVLIGSRHALLGAAYADAPRHVVKPVVRSIGIFMGGVDAVAATGTVLDALDGLDCAIEVATTSANPHLPTLRARGVRIVCDLPDLAGFFARHDLQIGAGGGASWERCCIGAPTLLLAVADNQRATVPILAELGVVATCAFDPAAIRTTVEALISAPDRRHAMADRARALVDGKGALRIALHLTRDTLVVRPATRDDAAVMFDWRNDPATRGVSRNPNPIAWHDHCAWLDRVLDDPEHQLFVAQVGSLPVGVIRFDRIATAACEVSLYLDPTLHALGLGHRMLLAGETAAASGLDIHAEVIDGNFGSARMFARAGYNPVGPNMWIKPSRRDGR